SWIIVAPRLNAVLPTHCTVSGLLSLGLNRSNTPTSLSRRGLLTPLCCPQSSGVYFPSVMAFFVCRSNPRTGCLDTELFLFIFPRESCVTRVEWHMFARATARTCANWANARDQKKSSSTPAAEQRANSSPTTMTVIGRKFLALHGF